MELTIISHFYNEEYLLPWWLNHHKKYFNHGILIDYHSTDSSVEIIKNICPTWQIITSNNTVFDSDLLNKEVESVEESVKGWRIVLNTTEFLIGDYKSISNIDENFEIFVPASVMVDVDPETIPNQNIPIINQKYHGLPYTLDSNFRIRHARKLSNFTSEYPVGRHYTFYSTHKFHILWYGFSPFNKNSIKRKLQIQNKISESDRNLGRAVEHITDEEKLNKLFEEYQSKAVDMSSLILKNYIL